MTSLDMNGFSLSLATYPVNEENPLIGGEINAPAWVPLKLVSSEYSR